MPARLPLLHKTPFHLDPRPLAECSSAQAGLLSASRALRSLHLPGAVEANVSVKQRARGLSEAQYVESALLLHIAGGECDEDAAALAQDRCLERGLGYAPSRPDALRKFLEVFHDSQWEKGRPAAEAQKTFLPEPTPALAGLGQAATELDYVPGAAYEQKQARPLRYIGLRLAKAQGELFADGARHHCHAVISNRRERGDRLLAWHREKAGTVEHTHEEVKNGLGGGRLPSGKFGANAAWFRLAVMAYNVVSAMRGLALGDSLRTAKLKRLRLWVFALCGRMSCTGGRLRLRLNTDAEGVKRLRKIWEVFCSACCRMVLLVVGEAAAEDMGGVLAADASELQRLRGKGEELD